MELVLVHTVDDRNTKLGLVEGVVELEIPRVLVGGQDGLEGVLLHAELDLVLVADEQSASEVHGGNIVGSDFVGVVGVEDQGVEVISPFCRQDVQLDFPIGSIQHQGGLYRPIMARVLEVSSFHKQYMLESELADVIGLEHESDF